MTSLHIAQFVCLFMLTAHGYRQVSHPSTHGFIALNVWGAALVVLIAFMPQAT